MSNQTGTDKAYYPNKNNDDVKKSIISRDIGEQSRYLDYCYTIQYEHQ